MSLTAVMQTAISGLNTQQRAIDVVANNITNVNNDGYARRELEFTTQTVAGRGAGVSIGQVRRVVDRFLEAEFVTTAGQAGYFSAQSGIYDKLQAMFGPPDSDGSLTSRLDRIYASMGELAVDPSDAVRRLTAVEDIRVLGAEMDRMAREVQRLRADIDSRIADHVNTINDALARVHDLNKEIAKDKAVSADVSGLEEKRAAAIDSVADLIDIRVNTQSNGYAYLTTTSGLVLLDSRGHELVYPGAGVAETTTSFAQIQVHALDKTGALSSSSVALEPGLRSGELKGLLDMRDKELPNLARNLGQLAAGFADQMNATHNKYSAVPPPNTLTGVNTGALSTDPHGFGGIATFAVLDSNNEISSSVTIDFTTGGYANLGAAITAINAGLTGATMSLTNGVLTFDATNASDGVAILPDATTPASRGGRGFSHFFGLNNLIEARAASHADTGLASGDTHGFGSSGTVDMELIGPDGTRSVTYTLDLSTAGGTVGGLITALNTGFGSSGSFGLDANGELSFTPASGFTEHALYVTNDTTARGSTGVSFSKFFHIGSNYEMDPAFDLDVAAAIAADANLLATATLDTGAATGVPALNVGDNSGISALNALAHTTYVFDANGALPQSTTTATGYAGQILSRAALDAAQSDSREQDSVAINNSVKERRATNSGVNLDEELSKLVVYENAYNAAARLITTANDMFDTLLGVAA